MLLPTSIETRFKDNFQFFFKKNLEMTPVKKTLNNRLSYTPKCDL